jgi:hypothetical protein
LDLNGRLPHHWLDQNGTTRATLDLLGDGLTLLVGPDEGGRRDSRQVELDSSGPATVHVLEAQTANLLDIPARGGLLLRPDGRELLRASTLDYPAPNSGMADVSLS